MQGFFDQLQGVADDLREQAKALSAHSCQDEADLTKIRANIYEVCATIGNVVCKTQPEDARERAYLAKLEALPRNWQVALEAAKAHNNAERAAVEELKLEALADVLARFHARKEG